MNYTVGLQLFNFVRQNSRHLQTKDETKVYVESIWLERVHDTLLMNIDLSLMI